MKKAQGMSLNVVIIAALVVLVLIVLSVIFIRSSGTFVDRVASCSVKGGKCAPVCGDMIYGTEEYSIPDYDAKCSDASEICCLKISN